HIFERSFGAFLDPLLIIGIVAQAALIGLQTSKLLWFVPLLVILGRLGLGAYRIGRRVWDDLMLLRKGLMLRAHVLRLRPYRSAAGQLDGALLDCAIAVAPRRTYLGSIWLADGIEAARLA